jgi:hypothetical protein
MVEFKKRYGLEGASNGLDVTHDWSPTMTPAWGLPILMDPRLNGIPISTGNVMYINIEINQVTINFILVAINPEINCYINGEINRRLTLIVHLFIH